MRFLVDSGATYTLLPHEDWQAIELSPKRPVTFALADGTTVERKVSECHITLPQGEGHTPLILWEPGDEPLLRTVTLEILHFGAKPLQSYLATDADAPCLIGSTWTRPTGCGEQTTDGQLSNADGR